MSENTRIINVSDNDFEEQVIQSDVPVLVDFWAEWCGPCKMITPIFEELANIYASDGDKTPVKFVKVNVDENEQTPTKYGVRGIPTLMLFKEGTLEATKVGAITKSQLISFIDNNI
jgi:thioredoxin 1